MESLPPEIVLYIAKFAGLFRTEVFASFFYPFFGDGGYAATILVNLTLLNAPLRRARVR